MAARHHGVLTLQGKRPGWFGLLDQHAEQRAIVWGQTSQGPVAAAAGVVGADNARPQSIFVANCRQPAPRVAQKRRGVGSVGLS